MRDKIRQIEATIRHLQCLLSEMLLGIQVLDIRHAEMAEIEVRLLPHKDEGVGSIPTSAIKNIGTVCVINTDDMHRWDDMRVKGIK